MLRERDFGKVELFEPQYEWILWRAVCMSGDTAFEIFVYGFPQIRDAFLGVPFLGLLHFGVYIRVPPSRETTINRGPMCSLVLQKVQAVANCLQKKSLVPHHPPTTHLGFPPQLRLFAGTEV